MSIIEIIVILLSVPFFIVSGLAIFYFQRVMSLLRGSESWKLYNFGAAAYIIAFIFTIVELVTKDITYSYLVNLFLTVGSTIFAYAAIKIYSAMKKVMK